MKTVWGRNLDLLNVLPEYPRPQMERASYFNLNGVWSYSITESDTPPDKFEGDIVVPFSPESELSGVQRTLLPSQTLWYMRTFRLPEGFNIGRVLLHIGAVDQIATVYINGVEVCRHVGGYTPFSADITQYLQAENVILVKVRDFSDTSFHSRGKQKIKRGGIWYTAQSGIWQTVWIESVPAKYISALRITPLFDEGAVELTVISESNCQCCAYVGENSLTF